MRAPAGIGWGYRVRVLATPDPERLGTVLALHPGAARPLLIGRSPGPGGLEIVDRELSRQHLSVRLTPAGELALTDLKTGNGTTVNRARLWGTITTWGDAVIRAGKTVLHIGEGLAEDGDPRSATDPLVRVAARQLARGRGAIGLRTDSGCGARTFASALHRRSPRGGGVVILPAADWDAADPVAALPTGAGHTVLLRGVEAATGDALSRAIITAESRDQRLILESRGTWAAVEQLVGRERQLELPTLERRRAAVWGVTVAWCRRRFGQKAPSWSRGALAVWLCAPIPEGWRTLTARFEALGGLIDGVEEVRSAHVRRSLEPDPGGRVASPVERQRSMEAPTASELREALDSLKTVVKVAQHFGRTRRQIYRWMDAFGIETRGKGGFAATKKKEPRRGTD